MTLDVVLSILLPTNLFTYVIVSEWYSKEGFHTYMYIIIVHYVINTENGSFFTTKMILMVAIVVTNLFQYYWFE